MSSARSQPPVMTLRRIVSYSLPQFSTGMARLSGVPSHSTRYRPNSREPRAGADTSRLHMIDTPLRSSACAGS